MEVSTRGRTRAAWMALAMLVIAALADGTNGWRQARINETIASGGATSDSADAPREVQFAFAAAMAASGADEAAVNRFRSLADDSPLGRAARFNSANSLMRQAALIRAGNQPGQAIPLIELAKESYRELLRADPSDWGARYNLERAQRLLPDPYENETPPSEPPSNAERAATTMRGFSPGMP